MNKSKICIITPRSINDSPCLEKYKEIIKEPFDIIYWSKGENSVKFEAANIYKYTGIVPVEGGKLSKIKHYYLFTSFVKRIVKRNKYDKLIVFPTHMAWLLLGLLGRKYKGKYILDIRDYAGENNMFIHSLSSKAVKNAGLCSITSPAFKAFLPPNIEYHISHNIQLIEKEQIVSYRNRIIDDETPIVISFIGTVRFLEQQKKLISVLGNDSRFVLKFIGRGSEGLKAYCAKGKFNNVELVGQFDRNDLGSLYLETDIANNVYGNDNPALIYALSNKLYSAAMMGMPVLASPNTYTAKIIKKYNMGFVFDENNKHVADELYDYFRKLNRSCFHDYSDRFLRKVYADEEKYRIALTKFFQ